MQKRRRVSDSVLTGVLPALGLKKNAGNINIRGGHLASTSTVTSPLPWAVINFEIFWVLLSPNTKCADRLAKSCGLRSFQGSDSPHSCHALPAAEHHTCQNSRCGTPTCEGECAEGRARDCDRSNSGENDAVVLCRRHSADSRRKLGAVSPRTKRCRSGSWTSQRCSNGDGSESQGVGGRRCHCQASSGSEGGRRSGSGLPQANCGGRRCCCCCCSCCSCSAMKQAAIIKEVRFRAPW